VTELGSRDVLDLCAISFRQLDYWVRAGHLRPVDPAPGAGYGRRWPVAEVRVGVLMARLVGLGLGVGLAARVARAGVEQAAPGRRFRVWVDGDVEVRGTVPTL
jgi:hypothetical protein